MCIIFVPFAPGNWNICQFASTGNVISSSPPTRPFHWGLIKCMADTPCRAGGNENRRAPPALTEGGPMKSAELKGSRSCSPRMRSRNKTQIFQNLSIRLPLSFSFSLSLSLFAFLSRRQQRALRNNFTVRLATFLNPPFCIDTKLNLTEFNIRSICYDEQ